MLESCSSLYIGVSAMLGVLVARRQVNDPPAWCGAASTMLCGGRGDPPPFVEKLFSGKRDQNERGDLT